LLQPVKDTAYVLSGVQKLAVDAGKVINERSWSLFYEHLQLLRSYHRAGVRG